MPALSLDIHQKQIQHLVERSQRNTGVLLWVVVSLCKDVTKGITGQSFQQSLVLRMLLANLIQYPLEVLCRLRHR